MLPMSALAVLGLVLLALLAYTVISGYGQDMFLEGAEAQFNATALHFVQSYNQTRSVEFLGTAWVTKEDCEAALQEVLGGEQHE